MSIWSAIRSAFVVPTSPVAQLQVGSPWSDSSHLTSITLAELFPGMDPRQWPITRAEALSVPSMSAARLRIVGTLSRLPLMATKGVDADGAPAPFTSDIGLLSQPDDDEPHATTMAATLDDLLFDGVAWWAVTDTYATSGRPRNIVKVPLDRIRPTAEGIHLDQAWVTWLAKHRRRSVVTAEGGLPWLIRFDGPHPGVLTTGGRVLRSAVALERSAQNAADNPVPSIELRQTSQAPMDDDDVRNMIQSWIDARRKHGVGYTNAGVEVHTHGQQPEQLMINGRNQQSVEIARMVGIPAAAIDAGIPGSNLTYANLQDRLTDLVNFGLGPYAYAITGRLSMRDILADGVQARFDYADLYPVASATAGDESTTTTPGAAQ